MTTKRLQLQPGIWLNIVQTDRFKTGCFSFNLLQPLREDTAAVNALIPNVLLRGCSTYPDMQKISHRLDELYGSSIGTSVRKKGEVQSLGMYADFLEDRYADSEPVFSDMLQFLSDLLFAPCLRDGGFYEDYVSGEKQNLINSIQARVNDKRSYAVTRLLKHMCADEAYHVGRLGEAEALEHIDGRELYTRWQELLATSMIELFYLGQQSEEKVMQEVAHLISRLPERKAITKTQTNVVLHQRPVQFVEEALDVTQGKLSIGFRTPITGLDQRYPAMMVFNAVYGSGMTSKLFTKIREEQSLCYYASSSVDRLKGIMIVSSGIQFDKYELARDGIVHQLELCKQGQITDEELESAKNYLVSVFQACNDSPSQIENFIIGQGIFGCADTVEDVIEQLKRVTMDQVVEAANTITLDTVYFLKGVESA